MDWEDDDVSNLQKIDYRRQSLSAMLYMSMYGGNAIIKDTSPIFSAWLHLIFFSFTVMTSEAVGRKKLAIGPMTTFWANLAPCSLWLLQQVKNLY